MKRLLRDETGTALITAVILVGVMAMLGLAVHAQADNEQRQSGSQRVKESSLGVAEAALNAQVFQLSRPFPSAATSQAATECGAGVAAGTACPDSGDFGGFTGGDYDATCNGAAVQRWRTTVRDNGGSAQQYYDRALVDAQPRYDANSDSTLWVRAEGRAGCSTRAIVAQVRLADTKISFPRNVVTANAFRTTNNGKKVIVDTQGDEATPADVSLRCAGFSTPELCAQYERGKDQLSPDTLRPFDASLTPLLTGDTLEAVKAKARQLGTYYGPGVCPPSLAGEVVYVETLASTCGVSRAANSATSPGFLVIGNGVFNIGGNSEFYGVLYMRNEQNLAGAVVSLSGTAAIIGSVHIDGSGTVDAGSSKANIIFDDKVDDLVKGLSTPAVVPGTWRELRRGE